MNLPEPSSNEKEILDLLKKAELKKVPAELLKNYESEVVQKIQAGSGFPWGIAFAGSSLLVAVFVGVMVISLQQPVNKMPAAETVATEESQAQYSKFADELQPEWVKTEQNPTQAPAFDSSLMQKPVPVANQDQLRQMAEEAMASSQTAEAKEAQEFQKISDDLFLLQMLGEDEGLVDSVDQVASDLDLIAQVPSAISL